MSNSESPQDQLRASSAVAAPEGMIRITLEDETRFCFPCHIDGWVALGWQAHPPSPAPADDPPLPPAPAPTPATAVIEQIHDDQPLALEGAEPEPDQQLPDYGAMTKAQIIAEVERRYGLALDPGMTKAELVAEADRLTAERLTAERLTAGGLPAEAAPIAGFDQSLTADQEPSLPLDLLV